MKFGDKMINKVKNMIKNWLFKEEINKINNLYNIKHEINNRINILEKARDQIMSIIDIGVDIHYKHPCSWAVICIQGKPEYIKFIDLNHKDAREIMKFLKGFEGSNMIVDSPFYFKDMMKDWGL